MRTTPLDKPMRKVARKLLRKFGKAITYIERPSKTIIDRDTGKADGGDVDHPTFGHFAPAGTKLADGTRVSSSDEWILIAASDLSVEPKDAGAIRVGTRERSIEQVKKVYAGELVATYLIRVAR